MAQTIGHVGSAVPLADDADKDAGCAGACGHHERESEHHDPRRRRLREPRALAPRTAVAQQLYALCLHTDHATPPVQRPRAEHLQQLQRLTCSHRSDPAAGTPDRAGPALTSTVLGTGSASTEPVRYCVRPLFCWPVTRRTWDPKGPIA